MVLLLSYSLKCLIFAQGERLGEENNGKLRPEAHNGHNNIILRFVAMVSLIRLLLILLLYALPLFLVIVGVGALIGGIAFSFNHTDKSLVRKTHKQSIAPEKALNRAKEFNNYLKDQEWRLMDVLGKWGVDSAIGACEDTIRSIKSYDISQEKKSTAIDRWKRKKAYLEECKATKREPSSDLLRKDRKKNKKGQKSSKPAQTIDDDSTLPNKEYLDIISLWGYDDWKQDVLSYIAAVHTLSKMKNRYSALQSATFVANSIIQDFLASDGELSFFEFVQKVCSEMQFSSPSERIIYDLNGDIAKMLATGADTRTVEEYLRSYSFTNKNSSRPKPEELYPPQIIGVDDIDSFSRLAKAVSHMKLKHLNISDEDIDNCIKDASKKYNKREWKSFEDYFSHAFQFGYLTERRFQRLYFILYNIAQAKLDGYSENGIITQVGGLYVLNRAKSQIDNNETNNRNRQERNYNDDNIPYYSFSIEEHNIISVASRITRELYNHRLFRKSASIAITLINRYHKLSSPEPISEKQFFSLSITMLKKENKNLSPVYDTILHIANGIFSGHNKDQVYDTIRNSVLQPIIDADLYFREKNVKFKSSLAHYAYKDITNAIAACQLPNECSDLYSVVSRLNDISTGEYKSKEKYYKTMLANLESPHFAKEFDNYTLKVVRYIIQCKANDVPEISFKALVGSRFPDLYKPARPSKDSRKRKR